MVDLTSVKQTLFDTLQALEQNGELTQEAVLGVYRDLLEAMSYAGQSIDSLNVRDPDEFARNLDYCGSHFRQTMHRNERLLLETDSADYLRRRKEALTEQIEKLRLRAEAQTQLKELEDKKKELEGQQEQLTQLQTECESLERQRREMEQKLESAQRCYEAERKNFSDFDLQRCRRQIRIFESKAGNLKQIRESLHRELDYSLYPHAPDGLVSAVDSKLDALDAQVKDAAALFVQLRSNLEA